jgi:hypothetical protein
MVTWSTLCINASLALVGSRTPFSQNGAVLIAPSSARTSSVFWISWHDLRTPEADVYGRSLDFSAVARSNETNLSLSSGYSRGRHALAFSPVGQCWLVV